MRIAPIVQRRHQGTKIFSKTISAVIVQNRSQHRNSPKSAVQRRFIEDSADCPAPPSGNHQYLPKLPAPLRPLRTSARIVPKAPIVQRRFIKDSADCPAPPSGNKKFLVKLSAPLLFRRDPSAGIVPKAPTSAVL
jgi:hypothetical protein